MHFKIAYTVSGSKYEAPFQVHFHEYMHNLDYLAGRAGIPFSSAYLNAAGEHLSDVIMRDWDIAMRKFFADTATAKNSVYIRDFERQLKQSGWNAKKYVEYLADIYDLRNPHDFVNMARLQAELQATSTVADYRAIYLKHFDKFGKIVYEDNILVNETVRDFCQFIKDTYGKNERAICDLSDMFERFSLEHGGPANPFGFGHGAEYALDAGNFDMEATAEIVASMVTNPEALALIKKYLPNAFRECLIMLREMVKCQREKMSGLNFATMIGTILIVHWLIWA